MKRAHGYTLIEVMMGLAILAVGATGVVALQKMALIGNATGRVGDTAQGIAGTWAERLKADAIQWNDPMGVPDIGDTQWLKYSTVYDPANPPKADKWILAPEVVNWGSPVADIQGSDVFVNDDPTRGIFCTHLRMVQSVDKPITLGGVTHKIAIQAEIRVVWRRDLTPMIECRTTAPSQIEANDSKYGFYYTGKITIGQQEASN
jgi:type IV pilus assembly protein PilV